MDLFVKGVSRTHSLVLWLRLVLMHIVCRFGECDNRYEKEKAMKRNNTLEKKKYENETMSER